MVRWARLCDPVIRCRLLDAFHSVGRKNAVDVGSLGRIYYRGDGAEVTLLQRALVKLRYARKFEHVGYFDRDVQNAVQWFQGRQGLTEDGVVGPQTWAAIARLVDLTRLANNPYIHCLPRAH
jgi:hypothetical protein